MADDDSGDEEGTAEAGSTKKSTKRPKAAKKLDGAGQLAVQYAEDDIDELEASCKAGEAVPYEVRRGESVRKVAGERRGKGDCTGVGREGR